MTRHRKTAAVLCIALVVFAAFLPGGGPEIVWTALTPLWLVVPAVDVTRVVRTASRCDEQATSLLSLALLRAPPRSLPLV
jgi:hypothetical protein